MLRYVIFRVILNSSLYSSAENIVDVVSHDPKHKKLENLSTVMTLYSRRTFNRESFQWTKCVVKYLYDLYGHFSFNMLSFLVEVLEKGPSSVQAPVLTIIHCLLHYVDMTMATQVWPLTHFFCFLFCIKNH